MDLEILEYCDNKYRIKQEQYYLDLFKPEYNILKIAGSAPPPFRFSYEGGGGWRSRSPPGPGSSLGFKHSPETLLKFKNRKLSPEALANLKESKAGKSPSSLLREINHRLAVSHVTTVINTENNIVKKYYSIKAAAKDVGVCHQTL